MNAEPDSNIDRLRSPVRRLTGTARDPEGHLAAVEVAVVGVRAGARAAATRRCLHLQTSGRLRRAAADRRGICRFSRFLRARGTSGWS